MTFEKLTDQIQAVPSAITDTTLIHIVTTADQSQSPQGSSFKATLSQLTPIFSANTTVKNTVFVSKNGNDGTGLVERFDKPFLTIEAATDEAKSYFTTRSETNRVRIVVQSGEYEDIIYLYSFIDYDLGNSVITAKSGLPVITDSLGSFTKPTDGVYNNIIYGNASFINNNGFAAGGAGSNTIHLTQNGKYYIQGNSSFSLNGESAFIGGGCHVDFYIRTFKIRNNNNLQTVNTIQIYSIGGEQPNYVTINNSFISNNLKSNQKSTISIGGTASSIYNRLTLNNCQVQNYSTTEAAIQTGDVTPIGDVYLTLINTIIWCNTPLTADSLSRFANACSFTFWSYNSYANVSVASTHPITNEYVDFVVNSNIIANQGLPI